MKPFFSIIITTYNRPGKIIRAIESVLNQSFKDYELIIINDGSIAPYTKVEDLARNNNRINYFYKENEERSIARNYGIQKANGEFICFLDDDDYYLSHHLDILYQEIKQCDFKAGIYHTYSMIKDKDGSFQKPPFSYRNPAYTIQEYYATDGMMTMNSTCGTKVIYEEFPFDPELSFGEDNNQRLKAMSKYPIFQINEYTNVYDKSEETSTTNKDIKVVLGYIDSWSTSFSQEIIKSQIRPALRNQKLYHYYHLLLNYHRLELNLNDFINACTKLVCLKPSFITLKIVLNSLRWKINNR